MPTIGAAVRSRALAVLVVLGAVPPMAPIPTPVETHHPVTG
ncbi:hypothetical protein [Kribbella steppae]|nr:hypothetical protein [Kribbella steppae]